MVEVTDKTFKTEVLDYVGLVLVDFWAEWCSPCKAQMSILEAINQKYSDKLKIVKLNVDTNSNTVNNYKICGIPTLLFFQNGCLITTHVGLMNLKMLEETIKGLPV